MNKLVFKSEFIILYSFLVYAFPCSIFLCANYPFPIDIIVNCVIKNQNTIPCPYVTLYMTVFYSLLHFITYNLHIYMQW
jgi:hypothetical protein